MSSRPMSFEASMLVVLSWILVGVFCVGVVVGFFFLLLVGSAGGRNGPGVAALGMVPFFGIVLAYGLVVATWVAILRIIALGYEAVLDCRDSLQGTLVVRSSPKVGQ